MDNCDLDIRTHKPSILYFFFGASTEGSGTLNLLGTLIHQLLLKFSEDPRLFMMVERCVRKFTEPSEDLLVTLLKELAEAVGVL